MENHHEKGADQDFDRDELRSVEGTSLSLQDWGYYSDNLPPIEQRLWMRDQAQENAILSPFAPPPQRLPDAGPFIPPANLSWGAQVALVRDPGNNLAFDPSRLFDGIVAAKSGIRGLYDPRNRNFAKYQGLRANLAVLRNTLLSQGMDPAHLKTAAEALGEAFAGDSWIKRPFTNWLSGDVANVEAVGAAEMYKYLLKVQDKPAVLQGLRNLIISALGAVGLYIPDRNWNLPPLEATPFSPENLGAPPMAYEAPNAPPPNFAARYRNTPKTGAQLSRA